ncbi:MAG: HU family DNA-binding protein [Rhodospirillaceae bacterium]|nr:HU family DNA-binding protein [Rhodospirillaceae bacterium]
MGFGRFSSSDRTARECRNPRTGERIAIGPSAGVSFKAGEPLKDTLN